MEPVRDEALIRIGGLEKSFKGVPVLRGIDLSVRKGEVAFVIGPSGGGKSTLLRCMNFLETPNAGTVSFAGQKLCQGSKVSFQLAPDVELRKARARRPCGCRPACGSWLAEVAHAWCLSAASRSANLWFIAVTSPRATKAIWSS